MKAIIGWILNHLPRGVMQRLAGWGVPLLGLFYLGRGCECVICGAKRRKFLPYGYATQRENALCPNCLSLERHRLLWLYLTRETDIFTTHPNMLHIAPEVAIMKRLRRAYASTPNRYITADLESPLADVHFDVQDIPLKDNTIDVILCNHIMEHIPDDRRAMRELHRILKPGGWGVVLVPVDYTRSETFEDDTITDPEERAKIFGQYDHCRIYGRDYSERLQSAGFIVEQIEYFKRLSAEQQKLYSLSEETIYIVRK